MPKTHEDPWYEATFQSIISRIDGSRRLICENSWLNDAPCQTQDITSQYDTRSLVNEIACPADSEAALEFVESALDAGEKVHVIWNSQNDDTIIGDPKVEGART
jgi:hypothetical protein